MDLMNKGWAYLLVGLVVRFIIARRRFNRRGVGGLQHYRSFEHSVVIRFVEWTARWTAVLMIVYGVLNLLAGLVQRDKEREQEQRQEQVITKPLAN